MEMKKKRRNRERERAGRDIGKRTAGEAASEEMRKG